MHNYNRTNSIELEDYRSNDTQNLELFWNKTITQEARDKYIYRHSRPHGYHMMACHICYDNDTMRHGPQCIGHIMVLSRHHRMAADN